MDPGSSEPAKERGGNAGGAGSASKRQRWRRKKNKEEKKGQSKKGHSKKEHSKKGRPKRDGTGGRAFERRVDKSDGNSYTYQEFISFYGKKEGERLWTMSPSAGSTSQQAAQAHSVGSNGDRSAAGAAESCERKCPGGEDLDVSEIEENRQTVADEIEALKSIYGESILETKSVNKLEVHIENDVKGRRPLHLTVTLPVLYPSRSGDPVFSLFAEWLADERKADAVVQLMEIGDQDCGCPVLFNWIEWLKENLKPPPAIQQEEQCESRKLSEMPPKLNDHDVSQLVVLGRRLIYSHHIIAQSKRAAVSEWARDLDLGGYYKIGWPGSIVVEGQEANLKEYVRSLKRLTWKHLAVRGEETVTGSPGQSVDDLRVLPKKMVEIGEDGMSTFADHCKSAGLHDLFLTLIRKNHGADEKARSAATNGNIRNDTQSWTSGEAFVDRKSTFQAHLIRIRSRKEADAAMRRLLTNRKIARATHNISAYRFQGENGGIIKDCNDDGETAAGGRLLHLLDLSGAIGMLVVVSRWYGGVHLGPDRFRHINNAARKILEDQGFINSQKSKKTKVKKSSRNRGSEN
eukprot:CAMPEP_0114535602 /NCGR_PEP_ID=MMETSP0109-20121206/28516_1 /TAXON_ID=29199 /ORGANISM="Chlorarachnion reptans, Strain CCCM449" /LENGTH=573 /DNA_ID=CAMNT_0001719203 /DNA_START=45 /DNA_END=1767 /DNA_ORIENTATION=-